MKYGPLAEAEKGVSRIELTLFQGRKRVLLSTLRALKEIDLRSI